MGRASFLQRYSQRENHLTNNTVLVLQHLYLASPAKLEQVIREILEDDSLSIGLQFALQRREAASVPDAVLSQPSFDLYIETKPKGVGFDLPQLRNHLDSIRSRAGSDAGQKILLGLSGKRLPPSEEAALQLESGVIFRSVTFEALLKVLTTACREHEVALSALIEDYREFLAEEGLLEGEKDLMLIVPCGVSAAENARFGIYYDGIGRPNRSTCSYIGAYWDKSVRLVGRVEAVLVCRYAGDEVVVVAEERGVATPAMIAAVRDIIDASNYYPGLKDDDHRYFILDGFEPTLIEKPSKGSVRGAMYQSLKALLGIRFRAAMPATEIAPLLRGKTFGGE